MASVCTPRAALAGCQALFHVAADYRIWVPDPVAMMRTNVPNIFAIGDASNLPNSKAGSVTHFEGDVLVVGTEMVPNELITRCRAAENELFIAVVNHARRFNGGSFLVGPTGEVLHQTRKKHTANDVLAFFKWIDLHVPRDLEVRVGDRIVYATGNRAFIHVEMAGDLHFDVGRKRANKRPQLLADVAKMVEDAKRSGRTITPQPR